MATGEEVQQTLTAVVRDPAGAVSSLPTLVSLLDHDTPGVRVSAAWGICLIVTAEPAIADRVREEIRAEASSDEAVLVGQWLRTGAPAPASDTDPPPDPFVPDETAAGLTSDADDAPASGATTDLGETEPPTDPDAVVVDGRFTVPLADTRLDRLEIVERVEATEYRRTYVGLGTIEGEESAVWLRSYSVPNGVVEETFRETVGEALETWMTISPYEHVLNVHDTGRRPQPWAIVEYAAQPLRAASQPPVDAALTAGLGAANGVAFIHEHGVVHGTIDLRSVAYVPVDDDQIAAIDGVGVGSAFRAANGPIPLDPRYSAPEQFDDDFGSIDRRTDVFQLGAVLYTLLTGAPPRDVRPDEAADGPDLDPPTPSAADPSLPASVDAVVETAMAPQKLSRYESADAFAAAIQRLLDGRDE